MKKKTTVSAGVRCEAARLGCETWQLRTEELPNAVRINREVLAAKMDERRRCAKVVNDARSKCKGVKNAKDAEALVFDIYCDVKGGE